MFTGEMFVETYNLKRDGLRGKKLAKSMAERFSSYSSDELKLLAESVPSPELRRKARGLHALLLALLGFGAVTAALSVFRLFSGGDRSMPLLLAAVVFLFRAVPIYLIARYRRDGALLVLLGAGLALTRISSLEVFDVAFVVVAATVAWLWVAKLFPNLTWRGQLR
jgi:hypothetical protein